MNVPVIVPLQVLPDRIGQAGGHRRIETESSHIACCRRHNTIQAGKSDGICMGNPRPSVGRMRLLTREYSKCQLDQQVHDSS